MAQVLLLNGQPYEIYANFSGEWIEMNNWTKVLSRMATALALARIIHESATGRHFRRVIEVFGRMA